MIIIKNKGKSNYEFQRITKQIYQCVTQSPTSSPNEFLNKEYFGWLAMTKAAEANAGPPSLPLLLPLVFLLFLFSPLLLWILVPDNLLFLFYSSFLTCLDSTPLSSNLSGIWQRILQNAAKEQITINENKVVIFYGDEGVGKSSLISRLQVCAFRFRFDSYSIISNRERMFQR